MALVTRSAIEFYRNFVVGFEDPRVDNFMLISSPLPVLGIIAAYFYFVYNLGPKLMRNRKPFRLKSIIIIYNIIQVTFNAINATVCLKHMLDQRLNWACLLAPWGDEGKSAKMVTQCSYVYFLLKLLDLLDTIFFVLRKKSRQITFLHTYHHAGMLAVSYVHVKFLSGGGHGVFLGLCNSNIHVIMYGYYLATSLPNVTVHSSWKKFITQIQMVQFLVIIIHNLIPFFIECSFFKFINFFLLAQNSFMLVLFLDFYRKTYS